MKAAIEGRLPQGMGTIRLTDLSAEWFRQYEILGFARIRTGLAKVRLRFLETRFWSAEANATELVAPIGDLVLWLAGFIFSEMSPWN